jgi:hypothetical protein
MHLAIEIHLALLGCEVAARQAPDGGNAGVGFIPLPQPGFAIQVEGTGKDEPSIDLFGRKTGFLHPSGSILSRFDLLGIEVESLQGRSWEVVQTEHQIGALFKLVGAGNQSDPGAACQTGNAPMNAQDLQNLFGVGEE